MNLFSSTSASPGPVSAADPVNAALRNAAATTGTGFDYLLTTAQRESGLDPSARAGTSSATGLFQFIDSTWLQMVKEAGPALGLGEYADRIEKTGSGSYVAPDPGARQQILSLRNDPDLNALMAGALTQHNRQALASTLGREPTQGELYVAHFMGAQGASSLIRLAATDGGADAAKAFPRQADANPSIFFDDSGQSRSASDVYANLVHRFDSASASPTDGEDGKLPANPAAWLAIPAHNAYAAESQAPFHGLFRSDARAPISNYVRSTWGNMGTDSPPAPATISSPARPAEPVVLAPPHLVEPAPKPSDDGLLANFGSFFSSLFAASQSAPLRNGKAWGG